MNKRLSKTVAAAAISIMLLGTTACSNGNEETPAPSTSETTPADNNTAEETDNNEAADDGSNADAGKQEEILNQLVTAEAAQIDAIKDQFPDIYEDIAIEYELPGTIKYMYTFAEAPEELDAMVDYFEEESVEMEQQTETRFFPIMRNAGLEGDLTIRYIYLAPDGSLIWDKTFNSAD